MLRCQLVALALRVYLLRRRIALINFLVMRARKGGAAKKKNKIQKQQQQLQHVDKWLVVRQHIRSAAPLIAQAFVASGKWSLPLHFHPATFACCSTKERHKVSRNKEKHYNLTRIEKKSTEIVQLTALRGSGVSICARATLCH